MLHLFDSIEQCASHKATERPVNCRHYQHLTKTKVHSGKKRSISRQVMLRLTISIKVYWDVVDLDETGELTTSGMAATNPG